MRLEGAHMLRARVGGRQPELRTIGALGRSRRFVVLGLCLLSVYAAFGLFAGAAEATTPSGALGALNGASDTATPFGALQRASLTANSSPDPSLVGSWSVTSSCSGSPCGDTLDISIGGQQASDPACSANEYCITTESGFYAKDVSVTPNGGGSWTYTCDGCTGSEDISVTFKGDTFTGMATGIALDGSVTGTVPYSGSCSNCVADQTYEISGTLTNNNCGCSSVPTPEPQPDVTVNVASDDGAGVSASGTSNDKGVWSVDVPDGDYTVTPDDSTYSWHPTSQQVKVDGADEDDIDFDTCGNGQETSDSADILSRGGPTAHAATDAKHCTYTNPLKCLDSILPTPAACVVTVTDISSNPSRPTGTVTGNLVGANGNPSCTLMPLPRTTSSSTCVLDYEASFARGERSYSLKATYDGDDTHSSSSGVGRFTLSAPHKVLKEEARMLKAFYKEQAHKAFDGGVTSLFAEPVALPLGLSFASMELYYEAQAEYYEEIVEKDPPNPAWHAIFKAKPIKGPHVKAEGDLTKQAAKALDGLFGQIATVDGLLNAIVVTDDRLGSATAAGSSVWRQRQTAAMSVYAGEAARAISKLVTVTLKSKAPLSTVHIRAIKFARLKRDARQALAHGLSRRIVKLARSFGVSTAAITSGLREVASAKTRFSVPTSLYAALGVSTLVAGERAEAQQFLAYAKALAAEAAAG